MVVFDATMLMLMLRPNSGTPLDSNNTPISHVPERIAHLVQTLEKRKTRIIIPTPALSEVLVRSGSAAPQIVETLNRSAIFRISPFDSLAAIEAAVMTRAAIDVGDKRGGALGTWAKVKFDRQSVAIAKAARASAIYSDDSDVRTLALAENISVIGLAELPVPSQSLQIEMLLEPSPQEDVDAVPETEPEAEAEADDSDEGDDTPEERGSA